MPGTGPAGNTQDTNEHSSYKPMHTTLFERLRRTFPFVGQRAVTERDLFDYADAAGVPVTFDAAIRSGVYATHPVLGDHIFLSPRLRGASLVYVLAHEIAHHLLHVPTRARGVEPDREGRRCGRRNHDEAETAVALLMFTAADLESAAADASMLETRDLAGLLVRRWEFFRHNGR